MTFFLFACRPKYMEKAIKRITSIELLFPSISISIFLYSIKIYFTYLNSLKLYDLFSYRRLLQIVKSVHSYSSYIIFSLRSFFASNLLNSMLDWYLYEQFVECSNIDWFNLHIEMRSSLSEPFIFMGYYSGFHIQNI